MSDQAQGSDLDFLLYVVKSIVEQPDLVSAVRVIDDMGVLITLTVGKDDMGKIIGKGGQTAKALRTLLHMYGSRRNERVNLKIAEPEGTESEEIA